jgi:hypothetical protein
MSSWPLGKTRRSSLPRFPLAPSSINVLRRAGREPDAKIWDDLLEIIRTEPGLEFWIGIRLSPSATKNVDGLFIENKEILESDPFASCIYT